MTKWHCMLLNVHVAFVQNASTPQSEQLKASTSFETPKNMAVAGKKKRKKLFRATSSLTSLDEAERQAQGEEGNLM